MAKRLKEYRMKFEKLSPGETIDPYALGLRSKLGGEPAWDQADETPECPSCNKPMVFVAQIDSIEHDSKDNPHRVDCLSREKDFMFGDVGIIYVFFCFDCLKSQSVFQCG
ncbi:MAG: hypothetical protein ACYS0I_12710 [Planctomycetota bacterium]